uniref:Uncharacterized protein n=1 Tax=Hubei diptera virus 21 TaxID=1922882 RepID=A0A1L3KP74_9VIRU|nr:hypothetical protein 4 [Hubei diptera virus 21]
MSLSQPICLWNYLPNGNAAVTKILDGMIQDINLPNIHNLQLAQAFGRRLGRLFLVGKNKFHPMLLTKLQVAKKCGIFLYSSKPKNLVDKLIYQKGWGKSSKIHYIKSFPSNNYFDIMLEHDVIVFREGRIPAEIDVYFLDEKEKLIAKERKLLFPEHHVFLVDISIKTNINEVNIFSKLIHDREIIGIGGKLKGFPNWYVAIERYSTQTLLDSMDQVQIQKVALFFAKIGCFIPGCLPLLSEKSSYWHDHVSLQDPSFSAQNELQRKDHKMISFGGGYRVSFTFDDESIKRCVVPINVFKLFLFDNSVFANNVYSDAHFFLFRSTYSSSKSTIENVSLKEVNIECQVPRVSMETIGLSFRETFNAILLGQVPTIVIVTQKGTLKSTFASFIQKYCSDVVVIDSDDYLVAIGKEYQKLIPFEYYNEEDGIILNWFRNELDLDLEIDISKLKSSHFDLISNSRILLSKFQTFWSNIFNSGFERIENYHNFIDSKSNVVTNKNLVIVLTHNLFEARLCQSKTILVIDSGVDSNEVLMLRAIRRPQTVRQYIAHMLYQKFSESNEQLHFNVIGWGDLLALMIDLGILREGSVRESVH